MEYEESKGFTPRGSTKLKVPGAKVAASLKRRFSNRLSRTVSSERAPGSDASNDNAETPRTKIFSLKHRRSKSRVKKEEENTRGPRRSFSVGDMSKMVPDDVERQDMAPLETEVKVPPMDTEAAEAVQDPEGLLPVPPETPVPEQRPVEIRDTRSSSNISIDVQEPKDPASDEALAAVETTEPTEKVEVVEPAEDPEVEAKPDPDVDRAAEIEIQPETEFELSPDADATIDAGIEEAVMASLVTPTETAKTAEPEEQPQEPEPEVKTLDEVQAVVTESMEAIEKPAEVETQTEVHVQPRETELEQLIAQETEAGEDIEPKKQMPEAAPKKPRKKRFAKLIKPASVSLATLAVGLLLILLKKH